MLSRDEIIRKVLSVIDELGNSVSIDATLNYPIANLLDQAGRDLLMVVPVGAINTKTTFNSASHKANADGTGEMVLPDDFVRLLCFKMRGWHRGVYHAISTNSNRYAKQFHRATRGGVAAPVVAISANRLEYFSVLLDAEHFVEVAEYVGFSEVDSTYPHKLVDVLIWLTAAMSLKVMSEYDASKLAMEEYERLLNNLYVNYGK